MYYITIVCVCEASVAEKPENQAWCSIVSLVLYRSIFKKELNDKRDVRNVMINV